MSRKALEQDEDEDEPFAPVDEEEEDDPFAIKKTDARSAVGDPEEFSDQETDSEVEDDEEMASDEALSDNDVELFKNVTFPSNKRNQLDSAESEEDGAWASLEDEQSEALEDQSTDASEVERDEDEEDVSTKSSATSTPSRDEKPGRSADREEFRRFTESRSTAGLASALSAGANADVKKGQAVKQQRQTFDRLLDARIKLQKGITAMNELPTAEISNEAVKNAARQAEDAALSLWSTIDSIRRSMLFALDHPSSDTEPNLKSLKRDCPFNPTHSTPLTEIWDHTSTLESRFPRPPPHSLRQMAHQNPTDPRYGSPTVQTPQTLPTSHEVPPHRRAGHLPPFRILETRIPIYPRPEYVRRHEFLPVTPPRSDCLALVDRHIYDRCPNCAAKTPHIRK